MFRRGQKVVCVDDAINPWATANGYGYAKAPEITVGEIYTISDFGVMAFGQPAIYLYETRYFDVTGKEWPFPIERFRPLTEQERSEEVGKHFGHHLKEKIPATV